MGLPSHNVRLAKPNSAGVYVRHRPETTLLYQVVQEYWPEFQAELASHGRYLLSWMKKGHLLLTVCCRIAGLRQTHQWVCWSERMNPDRVLNYRPQPG